MTAIDHDTDFGTFEADDETTELSRLIDALDMVQRERRRALAMYKPLRNFALEAHLDEIGRVLDEFRHDPDDEEEI